MHLCIQDEHSVSTDSSNLNFLATRFHVAFLLFQKLVLPSLARVSALEVNFISREVLPESQFPVLMVSYFVIYSYCIALFALHNF